MAAPKVFPISHYIRCIEKLKKPYPTAYLRAFLSEYTGKFTRYTSPDMILFDGKKDITIQSTTSKMTNEQIEAMLAGLVKYHAASSAIGEKYRFASHELIKRAGEGNTGPQPIVRKRRESGFPSMTGGSSMLLAV